VPHRPRSGRRCTPSEFRSTRWSKANGRCHRVDAQGIEHECAGNRFERACRPGQTVVVLTQNGAETVVRHQIGEWSPPALINAHVLGWSDIVRLTRKAARAGSQAERRLANELADYLGGLADMRNTESNSVYVVALGTSPFGGWPSHITPIDVVERWSRYFFPASGKNWPKAPLNYVAFRYGGGLQSIHRVDDDTRTRARSSYGWEYVDYPCRQQEPSP
jgi:hypothetical protein